jgi:hypothetical protein
VFEGLPVRRWHREWVQVGKPAASTSTPQPELPLPKDAHLLSSTSQGLLAAARAGSGSTEDTPKPREPAAAEPLFRTKRWVRIARDLEPPEPVYLAKVPDVPGKKDDHLQLSINTGDGSIVGTAAPRRRAPPPPKKKNKRPGRKPGFKKTVTFVEGQQPQADAQQAPADVEMMDVDAATKMDPAPQNLIAREIEKAESEVEAVTMAQEGHGHALPDVAPAGGEVKTE